MSEGREELEEEWRERMQKKAEEKEAEVTKNLKKAIAELEETGYKFHDPAVSGTGNPRKATLMSGSSIAGAALSSSKPFYTSKGLFDIMDKELYSKIQNEGNFKIFKYLDYVCCIQRVTTTGCLNGYVGIPKTSSLSEKDYDALDVQVHGGLTYASHKLMGVDDGLFGQRWWVGFDTAHYMDVTPFMSMGMPDNGTYKDMEYVKQEVIDLVEQLIKLNENDSI